MIPKAEVLAIFLVFSFVILDNARGTDQVDFSRDVRPILSDKCFLCHGPDENSRAAGLRLDIAEHAHEYAFVPNDLNESEAWQRIQSVDVDSLMPPPDSHKELSVKEIDLIKRWIRSGAKYEKHWAFRKIAQPEIPIVGDTRFNQSPIDSFVYRAMTEKEFTPSKQASKRTLIRRVSLDLTGLPPELNEIESFLADESSNAYEKLVDRLLASPQFGERLAVDWLDAARYGDTSVFHADGKRDMWRWRDWVVDAYNENIPFDQFTIKQLAGDLLPDKSVEDHLASGFNRNCATTDEGGAIDEEYRVEYVVDRIKTTSMVWMGLSMECAQCHDHKYDPISQKDYYRFYAFFNQAADPGMQSRDGNQVPVVELLDPKKIARIPDLESQIATLSRQLDELKESTRIDFEKWATDDVVAKKIANGSSQPPVDTSASFSFDNDSSDSVVNGSNANDSVLIAGELQFPDGKYGKAIRTTATAYVSSPEAARDFDGTMPISFGCWVQLAAGQTGAPIARMNEDDSYTGFDLFLDPNGIAAHFVHQWPGDAVKVVAPRNLKKGKWHHLFVTYDGKRKADGIKIYVGGKQLEANPTHNNLKGSTYTDTPLTIGRRKNQSHFDGLIDDVRIYRRELSASEVAAIAENDPLPALLAVNVAERTTEQIERLFQIYLRRQVPIFTDLQNEIAEHHSTITRLREPITSVMVMKDLEEPRMTFVLDRGQYDSPNKSLPVDVGVPAFLPKFDEQHYANNRLGLAQWLTSPEHPLTARVAVNRFWNMFFGNGIVESVEDFGLQGTWPSHPELLDWLASNFVSSGWDTKQLVKKIVMSQTYRQTSVCSQKQLEKDPENRYLSRGPRHRLSAEFLRDQALAVSGLLNPKMGGPGVKPYQPAGLWNEVSLDSNLRFKPDRGEDLYRRSIYTFWKRSSPPPNMTIFDTPSREKCTVRRGKTNTPLQALVLLNDPQFVEASRVFAERILRECDSNFRERIQFAFQAALARTPSDREFKIFKAILEAESKVFESNPSQTKKLLSVGEKAHDQEFQPFEIAAWTIITSLIFNLDEFLTRG